MILSRTRIPAVYRGVAHLAIALLLAGSPLPGQAGEATDAEGFERELLDFVEDHCHGCHGRRNPKGDLSLKPLETLEDVLGAPATWKKVLDAVEGFEMPPSHRESPAREERRLFVARVRSLLATPRAGSVRDPGPPVLRRLTRLEYNNTVRDLLGLETDVVMFSERLPFDKSYFVPARGRLDAPVDMASREYGARYPVLLPDAGLPGDSRAEHGFTNRGDAQEISEARLEQYLLLARRIAHHPELLERAEWLGEIFPEARFRPRSRSGGRGQARLEIDSPGAVAPAGNVLETAPGSARTLDEFRATLARAVEESRGAVFAGGASNTTVPGKGGVIRVRYGRDRLRELVINPSEDIWSAAFATAVEASGEILFTNRSRNLKRFFFALQPGENRRGLEIAEVGIVVLSRRGQQGTVRVTAEFQDETSTSIDVQLAEGAGKDNTFVSFRAAEGQTIRRLRIDGEAFSGEHVLLDDLAFITREEPLVVPPTDGQELPVVEGLEPPEELEARVASLRPEKIDRSLAQQPVPRRLERLLERAFRRPVSDVELAPYRKLFEESRERGDDETTALRRVLHAVLASPSFLVLAEREAEEPVRSLDGFELASRLSYFLWSSMPDEELFRLARSGDLGKPEILRVQVRRLLESPRVRELSENFFVEWARLRELWSAQPDREKFPAFYSGTSGKRTLAPDMFGEALLLFETVLLENLPVTRLIDSGETWVNRRLANHYGLENVPDTDDRLWHRVKLEDRSRGGLLTMGATLTLTSFPERTSPIRRGAWFLETIYNRPPPPPKIAVADIDEQENLDPDLPLRRKVEIHRENRACAVCHDRIDPPGFALERFDAIGAWREKDGKHAIDASGVLPDGASFEGPASFKDALRQSSDRFVRGFVEQLLSYALGRKLEPPDDATVSEILEKTREEGHRLRAIIEELCLSPAFRNVRGVASGESRNPSQEGLER